MTTTHELKTWPQYFEAVDRGEKTFEVRRDDRGFQKGDVLVLLCWSPNKNAYMKDTLETAFNASHAMSVEREVSWILTGGQFGIEPGYVVMGLKPLPTDATDAPA